ncbi:MAG: CHAD domain-containing protein [Candidatus Eremiobacteraeota bacterium]|nr:CHAD domain-containing protein [Candidatus Eremiobacteraeota bacterium]
MKPERVDLRGVENVDELVERVLQTRLREARELAIGLQVRDKQSLHDFRIACKRLRYALERFQGLEPSLEQIAERLALLQDALGEAHDRDVLLTILPPTMPATERRLQSERSELVERAAALWRELEQMMRALDSHRT